MAPIEERDLITLNAYLDNQLSPAERADFERRLGTDPGLQKELESLRVTVALLKQAEPVRAPRNFTLDPKIYGTLPRRSLFDRLGLVGIPQLVTAGGAIAATLICAGLIYYAVQGGQFGPAVGAPQAAMVESERAASDSGEETEAGAAAEMMQSVPAGEAAEQEETADAALASPAGEDLTPPPNGDALYGLEGAEGGAAGGGGGEGGAGGGPDGVGAGPGVTGTGPAEPTITILQATEAPTSADRIAEAEAPTDEDMATSETEMQFSAEDGEEQPEAGLPVIALAVGALVIVMAVGSLVVYRARRR